ncbi:MAG: hypothetical protein Q7S21_04825, partial [archaeon]|nr:hypothetical protein [archaeon]
LKTRTRKKNIPAKQLKQAQKIRIFAQAQKAKIKAMPNKRVWIELVKARTGKQICKRNGIPMPPSEAITLELLEKEFSKRTKH